MNLLVVLCITVTITYCKCAPDPDEATKIITVKRKPHILTLITTTLTTAAINNMVVTIPYNLQNTMIDKASNLFEENSSKFVKLIKALDTIYVQNSVNTDELFKNVATTVSSLSCQDTLPHILNLIIPTILSTSKQCVHNVATIAIKVIEALRDYQPEISKIIKTSKVRISIMDDVTDAIDVIPTSLEDVKTMFPECDMVKVMKDIGYFLSLTETTVKKCSTLLVSFSEQILNSVQ